MYCPPATPFYFFNSPSLPSIPLVLAVPPLYHLLTHPTGSSGPTLGPIFFNRSTRLRDENHFLLEGSRKDNRLPNPNVTLQQWWRWVFVCQRDNFGVLHHYHLILLLGDPSCRTDAVHGVLPNHFPSQGDLLSTTLTDWFTRSASKYAWQFCDFLDLEVVQFSATGNWIYRFMYIPLLVSHTWVRGGRYLFSPVSSPIMNIQRWPDRRIGGNTTTTPTLFLR